jgi:hypothetical protein
LNVAAASGGQGVEVDSAGIPWDERIHQASRNKKKGDGTWMLKRGLDPNVAQAVTAELLARKNGGPGPGLPAVANLPVSLPPAPVLVSQPAVVTAPVPGATQLPVPGQPAQGAVSLSPVEQFQAMMVKVGKALQEERFTQAQLTAAHTGVGLAQLQLAITQPHLIPAIEAALGL